MKLLGGNPASEGHVQIVFSVSPTSPLMVSVLIAELPTMGERVICSWKVSGDNTNLTGPSIPFVSRSVMAVCMLAYVSPLVPTVKVPFRGWEKRKENRSMQNVEKKLITLMRIGLRSSHVSYLIASIETAYLLKCLTDRLFC